MMISAKVRTPRVPNFVTIEFQDGTEKIVSLAWFKDEEIKALVKDWEKALLKERERQKKEGIK